MSESGTSWTEPMHRTPPSRVSQLEAALQQANEQRDALSRAAAGLAEALKAMGPCTPYRHPDYEVCQHSYPPAKCPKPAALATYQETQRT